MSQRGPVTSEWFDRAKSVLVNGVSSGFRYWGDDDTLVIDRGEGAHVWDMDGNRYVDYQLGFGPIVLGHGHPDVVAAASQAAARGTVFAMTTSIEVEAAEAFLGAIGWADAMRFGNTGTEATMHAIRLARSYTGRDVVVKFEGHYHGAHDYVLFSTAGSPKGHLGSRRSPVPWQASSGIPDGIRSYVRTRPFNDLEAVDRLFRSEGGRIAALIVEPIAGNLYGIGPDDGYLEGLRALCDDHGVVLIFDEVKTGFRLGLGGAVGAFGVTPDLATYAKAMGNGFPIAAIAGRSEIIGQWSVPGTTQAGTYSGNTVGVAATLATIRVLSETDAFARIERAGRALMDGIATICADAGQAVHVLGVPSMFGVYFASRRPKDLRDTADHDAALYERLANAMMRRGVMPVDEAAEPWFVSAAHDDEDVAVTLQVFSEALAEAMA